MASSSGNAKAWQYTMANNEASSSGNAKALVPYVTAVFLSVSWWHVTEVSHSVSW